MKRYQATVSIALSAKNKKEAKRIMREIVESGTAMGSDGTKFAVAKLYKDPIVEEMAF